MSRGIITAFDDSPICYSAFKLLYTSLCLTSSHLPITVVDLGIPPQRREVIEKLPNIFMMNLDEIAGPLPFSFEEKLDRWHSYNKPCYIRASPYPETLWLDVDCICFRPIDSIFEFAKNSIRITEDCAQLAFPNALPTLPNKPYVYKKYPVAYPLSKGPFINTGVIVCHPHRDVHFLDQWIQFTKLCHDDKKLRESISWWDQGVCLHVIESNGWDHVILRDIRYNHAVPMKGGLRRHGEDYQGPLDFLADLEPGENFIGHFAGYPKPWQDLASIPFKILRKKLQPYCQAA